MSTLTFHVQVRLMCQGDLPDVLGIDRVASGTAHGAHWGRDEFRSTHATRNRTVVVATYCECVVGFATYQPDRPYFTVERLTVDPNVRRRGVGRQLLSYVAAKAEQFGRSGFMAMVPESSLDGCRFLAAHGLKSSLVPGAFEREDGIRFVYRVMAPSVCLGV